MGSMCKSPDINYPSKGIGEYWPTTEGMVRISAVYGEGHEGDRGPFPPPFLSSFSTHALLSLALFALLSSPWPPLPLRHRPATTPKCLCHRPHSAIACCFPVWM